MLKLMIRHFPHAGWELLWARLSIRKELGYSDRTKQDDVLAACLVHHEEAMTYMAENPGRFDLVTGVSTAAEFSTMPLQDGPTVRLDRPADQLTPPETDQPTDRDPRK